MRAHRRDRALADPGISPRSQPRADYPVRHRTGGNGGAHRVGDRRRRGDLRVERQVNPCLSDRPGKSVLSISYAASRAMTRYSGELGNGGSGDTEHRRRIDVDAGDGPGRARCREHHQRRSSGTSARGRW